jgi:hypothetical protein
MKDFSLALFFGAPWLVATALALLQGPRLDHVPPSVAESARRRLWST